MFSIRSFNPLPSQKQGETLVVAIQTKPVAVSIRSPHKSKGRQDEEAKDETETEFQSAPLTKARGDSDETYHTDLIYGFNPLPSQKQGETRPQGGAVHSLYVSIRSPHKSKGRPVATASAHARMRFQSAPLTKARGDIPRGEPVGNLACFNPLPSQKQGETTSTPSFRSTMGFQSAPLTKARGDPAAGLVAQSLTRFNPLPSQKQGETRSRRPPSCLRRVSIRSPHKSKGRRRSGERPADAECVSIRSPHKSKGRPMSNPPLVNCRTSFNPLPSQKQGETHRCRL